MPYRPYTYHSRQTLEMCTTACADANFSYAGAQFSSECYCGEDYTK
ncbi:WSC domain-containing protein, partial [Erythrobacter sp. SN021]